MILPLIALIIIIQCFVSLHRHIRKERPLIVLTNTKTKKSIPVLYWENSIGRSKSSDIVLDNASVSRDHAVLYRRKEGWIISDVSRYGILVNGEKIEDKGNKWFKKLFAIDEKSRKVFIGDIITIGELSFVLNQYEDVNKSEDKIYKHKSSAGLLFLVTLFHLAATLQLCIDENGINLTGIVPFVILFIISWICFTINKLILKDGGFELESLGIFLSGISIISIFSMGNINQVIVQSLSLTIGLILFIAIVLFMRNPERVMKFRVPIAILSIGLLGFNLIFGSVINGSKNWIMVGNFSLQPSEIVKMAFILVGTATLNRLQTAKNLTGFIAFTGVCIGSLFLMGDFGTACIFFVTFVLMSLMRSGSIRTIILICAIAVLGLFIIIRFKPYVANRFMTWGHAWDYASSSGYQQTQTMTYCASGGLFGVGIGKGYLKNIFAAENDLIFGVLCEEWGMIEAFMAASVIILIAIYVIRMSTRSRSTLYSIASYSAAGMMVFQLCLNIFGCTDILPFTGVTFPFISLGGSSMISVWGLLAIIKSSDEYTYVHVKKNNK